eukprot:359794-Chlamydomonas_euryale.AAC.2
MVGGAPEGRGTGEEDVAGTRRGGGVKVGTRLDEEGGRCTSRALGCSRWQGAGLVKNGGKSPPPLLDCNRLADAPGGKVQA